MQEEAERPRSCLAWKTARLIMLRFYDHWNGFQSNSRDRRSPDEGRIEQDGADMEIADHLVFHKDLNGGSMNHFRFTGY